MILNNKNINNDIMGYKVNPRKAYVNKYTIDKHIFRVIGNNKSI